MQPGEFSESYGSSDLSSHSGSVSGSYLGSAFAEQPVGIEQVEDVWIDASRATSHMARNADLMYSTRPPPPHRSRGSSWVMDRSRRFSSSETFSTAEPTTQLLYITYRLYLT